MQLDRVLDGVDGDHIAISNECDGASDLRFRNDVADAEPVGPFNKGI